MNKCEQDKAKFYTEDEQFYLDFHKTRFTETIHLIQKYCPKGTIVDVGAYPFVLTSYFNNNKNYKVIGLDKEPKRKAKLISKLKINIKKCDIEKDVFPIQSKAVDVVLFCEIFEHLGCSPLFALNEIYRILKKDAIVIITTPNLYSLKNVISFVTGKGIGNPFEEYQKITKYGHMGHIKEYSRFEMKTILDNIGFDIINTSFRYYSVPTNSKIKTFLLKTILSVLYFLKPSQILICQKR